jgi:hypothetical protein
METDQIAGTQRTVTVHMKSGEFWIRLSLRIEKEHLTGDLVHLADEADVSIEPADELCSSYRAENWMSGVVSGALYAFRTLGIPRKRLSLESLSGRLRSLDMDALANGSATAISRLVEMELPEFPMEGWIVNTQLEDPPGPLEPARLATVVS